MELKKLLTEYSGQEALNKYSMPSDKIDPSLKKEEYCRRALQYLLAYTANYHLINGAGDNNKVHFTEKIRELRKYASGDIDIRKYKRCLLGKDSNGNQREKSFVNISWRPDMGYQKTLDQIKGAYDKMDYDLTVRALDAHSQYEREAEIAGLKLWQNSSFKAFVESMNIAVESPSIVLETEDDINFYIQSGGLKLQSELTCQKAIDASRSESKWRMLKYKLMDDMITVGVAVVKDQINKQTGVPVIRYVDPQYFIAPRSKYNDFRDMSICGEIREMTIAQVREESNLDEISLLKIAAKYGYNPNTNGLGSDLKPSDGQFSQPYDHIVVFVLDGCWLTADIEKYTKKKIDKYGTLSFNKVDFNYKLSEKEIKDGKELVERSIQYTYEGKLIIGTDICFGYGKAYNQTRKKNGGYYSATLPYSAVQLMNSSKVERMIPDVDEINILTYKRRNAVAAIPAPPGLIINKSALENVSFDGSVKTPIDLMNMLLEKGIMGIDTEDINGNRIENIQNIVLPVASAMFEQFRIYAELIDEKRRNIQITTGMNDMVDGSTDSERQLKVQGEAKLEAASNAIQPEYAMLRELIETSFTNIIFRWQQAVAEGDFKTQYKALSNDDIEILEITKDFSKLEFGLSVKLSSTYQERQMLLQTIGQYRIARQQTGTGGITEDVYLMIYRVIMSGNILLAQYLLAKSIERQRAIDEQILQKRSQENAMYQQQSAMVAEQEKRKTMFAESAAEIIKQHHQFTLDAALEAMKTQIGNNQLDEQLISKIVTEISGGSMPDLSRLQSVILGGQQAQQQSA